MSIGCPVGHPSGTGRHCPLCGRTYVPLDQVEVPMVFVPQPRHAAEDEPVLTAYPKDDELRGIEVEALAMLSSLASEFDH